VCLYNTSLVITDYEIYLIFCKKLVIIICFNFLTLQITNLIQYFAYLPTFDKFVFPFVLRKF